MPSRARAIRLAAWALLTGAAVVALDLAAYRALSRGLPQADLGPWASPDWRRKVEAFRRQSGPPPEAIFVGDSTMVRNVRPTFITPAGFNFGRPGLRAAELPVLARKLDQMGLGHPRLVVVALPAEEYRSLEADPLIEGPDRPGLASLLPHYYSQPQAAQEVLLPGSRLIRARVEAWWAGRQPSAVTVDPDGYARRGPDAAAPSGPPELVQTALPAGFLDEARIRLLRDIVAHWRGRGARVVYVLMPAHPDCRALYERHYARDRAQLREALDALLPGDVVDLEGFGTPGDFWDGAHLNDEGARKLSGELRTRLAPTLRELGLPVAPVEARAQIQLPAGGSEKARKG